MNKPALFILSALALSISSAARADSRLEITTASSVKGPDAHAIVHSLLPDAPSSPHKLEVRLVNHGDRSTLAIALTGAQLPADSVSRLKSMFPALRDAEIVLDGDASQPALPPLPPDPNSLSTPEQIAAYKASLQAQLAAEGKSGTVEVRVVDGADGKKSVMVEVHADDAK